MVVKGNLRFFLLFIAQDRLLMLMKLWPFQGREIFQYVKQDTGNESFLNSPDMALISHQAVRQLRTPLDCAETNPPRVQLLSAVVTAWYDELQSEGYAWSQIASYGGR